LIVKFYFVPSGASTIELLLRRTLQLSVHEWADVEML